MSSEPEQSAGNSRPAWRTVLLLGLLGGGLTALLLARYPVTAAFAASAQSGLEEEASDTNDESEALTPEERSRRFAILQRGQRLYRRYGCSICHGREGKGGVTNPNYLKQTFPSLDKVGPKLGLEFPEDAEIVLAMLAAGKSLDDPSKIDVEDGAGLIAARYKTMTNVILNGNPAMKKDPKGTEPIFMPSYKHILKRAEMNQILASFLILYPVTEEEE